MFRFLGGGYGCPFFLCPENRVNIEKLKIIVKKVLKYLHECKTVRIFVSSMQRSNDTKNKKT